jgi:hypothetical protein
MRRVLLWAFVFTSWCLAGCSGVHAVTNVVLYSGDDAQRWIARDAAAMLAARHPGLAIGKPRCPLLLNLAGGHAECTLPVDGNDLRVSIFEAYGEYHLGSPDGVVVHDEADAQVADTLTLRYGVAFTARCDGPPVRVMPLGEKLQCRIDAPDGRDIFANAVEARVIDRDGALAVESLKSGDTRAVRMLGRDAADRKDVPLVVGGAAMERYLREIVGGPAQHGELVRRGLIGRARCPARIALPVGGHARCSIELGGTTFPYALRNDVGRGLVVDDADVHFAIIPYLQEIAARYFAYDAKLDGEPGPVRVRCVGGPVVNAEPGSTLACSARAKNALIQFTANVLDRNGNFVFTRRPPGASDDG